MSAPLVISAAICGGEHGRDATPHLPITPAEIVESILGAHAAGAAIAHVHVWDEQGRPTQALDRYRDVCARVADAGCDVVLNLTTGPGGEPTEAERMLPLDLHPELASFDAGSLNFGEGVFRNDLPFLRRLARRMREAGTRPELEVFDLGMIATCLRLRDEGLLDEPLHVQFVLGVPGGAPASARTLVHLVDELPAGSTWSATGIGRASVPVAMHAIAMGGHVRVGLEDSIRYDASRLATSNAELVERVAALARIAGREIATPAQARELLRLHGAPAFAPEVAA
jgi:3-keto-5-aminohexanoate cleavage enzyme